MAQVQVSGQLVKHNLLLRNIRQQVGVTKGESTTAKYKRLGRPEMENQKRKAIVKDGRAIPPRKGDKSIKPARVRSHNEGKAGREESRKTIC
jgi:hypothetical protein